MITYQRESVRDLWAEIMPLLERHREEVGFDKRQSLNVDKGFYEALEDREMYRAITARSDGRLIGYAGYFIVTHPHYQHLTLAESDVFYIAPEERRGRVGIELFRKAELLLKVKGAQFVVNKCKAAHDLSHLFERLGYEKMEISFIRELT